jgi:hypothetical protein
VSRCVYRCEVKSVQEFIRRIAVDLVPRGYVFYVQGEIPEGKEPTKTDAKIIQQYGIGISKWTRVRQKQKGIARLHYVRLDRTFVILATHGTHDFYSGEAQNIRDLRLDALLVFGFRIQSVRGQGRVRFE